MLLFVCLSIVLIKKKKLSVLCCTHDPHVFFTSGYTVVGFAMYYFTYDPWIGKLLYLEDFYVMKEFRGIKTCYLLL